MKKATEDLQIKSRALVFSVHQILTIPNRWVIAIYNIPIREGQNNPRIITSTVVKSTKRCHFSNWPGYRAPLMLILLIWNRRDLLFNPPVQLFIIAMCPVNCHSGQRLYIVRGHPLIFLMTLSKVIDIRYPCQMFW